MLPGKTFHSCHIRLIADFLTSPPTTLLGGSCLVISDVKQVMSGSYT